MQFKDGVIVVSIRIGEEAEAFDNPDRIVESILTSYRESVTIHKSSSCIAVIETRVATSQLIRMLFQLYRECQKHKGQLYVCKFPEEYMISLSTLGLTELPGFHLAESEKAARDREKGNPASEDT